MRNKAGNHNWEFISFRERLPGRVPRYQRQVRCRSFMRENNADFDGNIKNENQKTHCFSGALNEMTKSITMFIDETIWWSDSVSRWVLY